MWGHTIMLASFNAAGCCIAGLLLLLAPTHKHECGHHPWLLEQLLLAIQANTRELVHCTSTKAVSHAGEEPGGGRVCSKTLVLQQLQAQEDAPTFAKRDVVVPKTMRPPTLKARPTCILPDLILHVHQQVCMRVCMNLHIYTGDGTASKPCSDLPARLPFRSRLISAWHKQVCQ